MWDYIHTVTVLVIVYVPVAIKDINLKNVTNQTNVRHHHNIIIICDFKS